MKAYHQLSPSAADGRSIGPKILRTVDLERGVRSANPATTSHLLMQQSRAVCLCDDVLSLTAGSGMTCCLFSLVFSFEFQKTQMVSPRDRISEIVDPLSIQKISKLASEDLRRTASLISCNPDDLSDVVHSRRPGRPPASPEYLLGISNPAILTSHCTPHPSQHRSANSWPPKLAILPRRPPLQLFFLIDPNHCFGRGVGRGAVGFLFYFLRPLKDLVVSLRDLQMKISDGDANTVCTGTKDPAYR
ncbi:hypothetical protein ACLOJK_005332 [Asimina triloba]